VKTYTVLPGDTLSKIAQKSYGNASLWQKIYQANKVVIGPNPNMIKPGQKLTIP
jgi:nucleoid-associated protein YgaU